jgi:hypothetical protein
MSNKKKSKHPSLGNDLHRNNRNTSREMKKLKEKNLWSNKNVN